jgi:hypothetical protein
LIARPDDVAEYSRRAQRYYLDKLRPQARMRSLLDEALGRAPTTAPSAMVAAVHP